MKVTLKFNITGACLCGTNMPSESKLITEISTYESNTLNIACIAALRNYCSNKRDIDTITEELRARISKLNNKENYKEIYARSLGRECGYGSLHVYAVIKNILH